MFPPYIEGKKHVMRSLLKLKQYRWPRVLFLFFTNFRHKLLAYKL